MNGHREFDIAFVGLKPGAHVYEYQITDKFFKEYDEQDFQHADATVRLTLDKKTGFFQLKFEIGGQVEVICDRCGNNLPLSLWDEFNLIVKMVDNPDEMNEQEEDPDIYYIHRNETHLHVADWIYEFINLSLPMTKMCSEKEIGGPHCNMEVLKKLEEMKPGENQGHAIWKDLEKFKKTDNN